jgi:large subunit ribosomal protein L17
MRHGKKVNHLSRTKSHRDALLSNMASSLILAKRITTTVAKAKSLRKYVEPLITKAKDNTQHSRRTVMSYLQNKESVRSLFDEVASRIGDRPGGYTRIIKLGDTRLGDNAEMCLMELVDFNDLYKKDGEEKKGKTRRSRGKGKKDEGAEGEAPAAEKPAKEPKAKAAGKTEKKEKKEKPAKSK